MSNIQLTLAFIRMGAAIRQRQGVITGTKALAFQQRMRSRWVKQGPEKNRHQRRLEAALKRREPIQDPFEILKEQLRKEGEL